MINLSKRAATPSRAMKILKSSLPILLIWAIFTSRAFAQTEIPVNVLDSGHLLVKAKFNDVEGNFIFDTGAGMTAVTKTFADKLSGVTSQDGGYTGFRATGERLDLDLFYVSDITLGAYKKVKPEIAIIDANFGGIDGIIALNIFDNNPFTIDLTAKVIRLENAKQMASIKKTAKVIPIQLEDSRGKSLTTFGYFKVNDALTLQLALDSGAGKNVFRLNSKLMQKLHVDVTDTTRVKKIEKRSEINEAVVSSIYKTQLKKLSPSEAPTISTTDFPVQFVDGLIYDGIIWINWLGKQLTFDIAHKELLVRD